MRASIAIHKQKRVAGRGLLKISVDLFYRVHRLPIGFDDHITLFESRLFCSGIAIDAANKNAFRVGRNPELPCEFGRQSLKGNSVQRSLRSSSTAGGGRFTSIRRLLSKRDRKLPFGSVANHCQPNSPARCHLPDSELESAGVWYGLIVCLRNDIAGF
jgi:hypothetical protein